MKIRISEALDNAKARMEREAAMQRANERRAAELAELEALRQVAAMARELVAVTELWPSIIWDEFRGRLDMYPAWKATQEALTALDAPAWMDTTREVGGVPYAHTYAEAMDGTKRIKPLVCGKCNSGSWVYFSEYRHQWVCRYCDTAHDDRKTGTRELGESTAALDAKAGVE